MLISDPILCPSKEYVDVLYHIYKSIHDNKPPLEGNKILKLTSALLSSERWAWRVVAISVGAAEAIKDNDYKDPPGLLAREHFIQRRSDAIKAMFPENGQPLERNYWWQLFWKNDPTILMLRKENKKELKDKIECYKLKWKEGNFADAGYVGYKFKKSIEGENIKEILSKNNKTYSLAELRKKDWRWKCGDAR